MKWIVLIIGTMILTVPVKAQESRIKDLVAIKGNRTNELMGFGLVVGLNGTGDTPASISTVNGMKTLLSRLGMDINNDGIIFQSAAAVVVTAQLPAFARNGDDIDIKLSVLGDATSLAGGTLLMTPLKAGDGNVYAVARGPVVVAQASGEGAQSLTVASIPRGGQIERNFIPNLVIKGGIELNLKMPDFTTNARIAKTINQYFRRFIATSVDPSVIRVLIPSSHENDIVSFISELENLTVAVDQKAVVVVNERTGTVVMGGDVKISPIVLSHNGLSIEVGQEGSGGAINSVNGSTVGELIKSLNAIGVQPPDLISIIQSIHASGALRAEIKYQ